MKCPETININGTEHQCRHELGQDHFPQGHEAKVPNADDKESGLIVRWSTYRTVQPCATGC